MFMFGCMTKNLEKENKSGTGRVNRHFKKQVIEKKRNAKIRGNVDEYLNIIDMESSIEYKKIGKEIRMKCRREKGVLRVRNKR